MLTLFTLINKINRFFNELSMQINNEKFKFISILQATRNFIIVILRINNNY